MVSSSARHGERQKGDVARALDRERDLALVAGAVAADAAGNDLAALADEVLERLRVLVIDGDGLVRAVLANALLAAAAPARRGRVEIGGTSEILVVVHHDGSSVFSFLESGDASGSSSTNSSSGTSRSRIARGASGPKSSNPSAFSRDSRSSSSGGSSRRWNFTSSGSTATAPKSTISLVSTVWNLSTASCSFRLR